MSFKKLTGVFLLLLIVGIATATAWNQCFVQDGVTISFENTFVKLENKAPEHRTVVFTVVFLDGTMLEMQQITVDPNSTETKSYGQFIKNVVPCY